MVTDDSGIVVVIPTRNRAELALNALRSVLGQPECNVRVMVSDNSTDAEDASMLWQFCNQCVDTRLTYVRPPQPMPMSEHWEWAMRQAMGSYDANHFLYLTDRMVFKASALKTILRLVKCHPDSVLTYNHDRIDDFEMPCRLEQVLWTGKLLEVTATRLLYVFSRMQLHPSLPRMLNCVVPRSILEAVRARFGSMFLSISPDFCFAFRILEVVDSILYYDRAPILHYALDRSNGASSSRGDMSKDNADFLAALGNTRLNFAAPIPELKTTGNAIMHEYCFVRREACSSKFPDVDKSLYLKAMVQEVECLRNLELKRDMLAILGVHGWNVLADNRSPNLVSPLGKLLFPVVRSSRMRWVWNHILVIPEPDTPLWAPVDLLLVLVGEWFFGYFPPFSSISCGTATKGINHVNQFPQRRFRCVRHLRFLLKGGGSIVSTSVP